MPARVCPATSPSGMPDQPFRDQQRRLPRLQLHQDAGQTLECQDIFGPALDHVKVDFGSLLGLAGEHQAIGSVVSVLEIERPALPVILLGLAPLPDPGKATCRQERCPAIIGPALEVILGRTQSALR